MTGFGICFFRSTTIFWENPTAPGFRRTGAETGNFNHGWARMNTDLREDVNRKQAAGSGRWALRKKDRGFETAKHAKYVKWKRGFSPHLPAGVPGQLLVGEVKRIRSDGSRFYRERQKQIPEANSRSKGMETGMVTAKNAENAEKDGFYRWQATPRGRELMATKRRETSLKRQEFLNHEIPERREKRRGF